MNTCEVSLSLFLCSCSHEYDNGVVQVEEGRSWADNDGNRAYYQIQTLAIYWVVQYITITHFSFPPPSPSSSSFNPQNGFTSATYFQKERP